MYEKHNPNNLLVKGYRFIEWKKEDEEKSKSQQKKLLLKEQNYEDKKQMTILMNLFIFQICHH